MISRKGIRSNTTIKLLIIDIYFHYYVFDSFLFYNDLF